MAAPLPKGLHHLESKLPHKFHHRYSPRVLHEKAYVPPSNRVRFWNIRQGDKVRLTVGKPGETHHLSEEVGGGEGRKLGWRVHEVTGLDQERNRVLLKSVTYKKSNPIQSRPPNYSKLSDDEKAQFDSQQNHLVISRPVHYSNVQLCVKERKIEDGGSLFATRLKTSEPEYDKLARTWRYERYAAKVVNERGTADLDGTDGEGLDVIETVGNERLVRVGWPEVERKVMGDPGRLDTLKESKDKTTLSLSSPEEIWQSPSTVPLPNSSRAPSTSLPRSISDKYIASLEDTSSILTSAQTLAQEGEAAETIGSILKEQMDPVVDSLMPLYLSDELSPRFSRAKATKGWSIRKEEEDRERKEFIQRAVNEWRAGGKDSGLSTALSSIGLEDLKLRPRTLQEITESASRSYDSAHTERSRIMRLARANGGTWDLDENRWKVELEGSVVRRREKKVRRKVAREERLRVMEL